MTADSLYPGAGIETANETGVEFSLRLADMDIDVKALFESTRVFCHEYLVDGYGDVAGMDGTPAMRVEVTPRAIAAERELSRVERERLGLPPYTYSDAYLETLALYRAIAERAPANDVLLVHGSALALDGAGYLFCGPSGAGKSTHARLWREHFGARVTTINDDKPLVRLEETEAVVCGSPWDGKHRLSTNTSAPLRAVCLVNKAGVNGVRRLEGQEAWTAVLNQVYRPHDADPFALQRTLELVDMLASRVPVYSAQCTLDGDVVPVVHGVISTGNA